MPAKSSLAVRCFRLSLLLALASAAGCVSIEPWRTCEAPCEGMRLERASEVELCKTNGFHLFVKNARWRRDERGAFVEGRGRTRPEQRWAPVKVYAEEIQEIRTQRVEPKRVATNVALLPLAMVFKGVTGEEEDDLLHEEEPQPCPPAVPRTAEAPPPSPPPPG